MVKAELITIFTEDVKRLESFYKEALDFFIFDDDGYGYEEYERDGLRVTFKYTPPDSEKPPFELAFYVETAEEVDSFYNYVLEHGGASTQKPYNIFVNALVETDNREQRVAGFADPDGNCYTIKSGIFQA